MSGVRGPWMALGGAAALGLVYWGWVIKIKPERLKAAEDAKILFQGLDAGSTNEILLQKKGNPDVLLRKVEGQWRLITPTAAPADMAAVVTLVSQLAAAKRNEIIVDKGADLRDFGLDQPSGEVTFKPASPGAKAQVLFFGLDSPAGDQAYGLIDGKPEVFLTAHSVKDAVLKDAAELRDKTVWTFDPTTVESVRSDIEGFGLSRDAGGQWRVDTATRHEPGKAAAVDGWLGDLSRLRADSVPSETGKGDFGLHGGKSLKLTLKSGAALVLTEGRKLKAPPGVFVQTAGQGPVFQLPNFGIQTLGRLPQDLMDLNVFSFETGAVKRFEVKRPLGTLVAVKNTTTGAWAWDPPRPQKPGEAPFDFYGFLASFANTQLLKRLDNKKDAIRAPVATLTFYGDNGAVLEKALLGRHEGEGQAAASFTKSQTVLAAANLLDKLPPDAAAAASVPGALQALSVTAKP